MITFSIIGNQQDPLGNPFPKLKMTGNQSWTPKAQSYAAWKRHVQNALMASVTPADLAWMEENIYNHKKPIVLPTDQIAFMFIKISFAGKTHGDPENIFGSIADALFHNDKNLYGHFLPLVDKNSAPCGRVDVIIDVSGKEFRGLTP